MAIALIFLPFMIIRKNLRDYKVLTGEAVGMTYKFAIITAKLQIRKSKKPFNYTINYRESITYLPSDDRATA
ncbi:MAG: hypothetical protein OHK0057_29010 [Thermoflexibacter sp.]